MFKGPTKSLNIFKSLRNWKHSKTKALQVGKRNQKNLKKSRNQLQAKTSWGGGGIKVNSLVYMFLFWLQKMLINKLLFPKFKKKSNFLNHVYAIIKQNRVNQQTRSTNIFKYQNFKIFKKFQKLINVAPRIFKTC